LSKIGTIKSIKNNYPWIEVEYRTKGLRLFGTKINYTISEYLAHDKGITRTQDGKDEVQTWPYTIIQLAIVGDKPDLFNNFCSPADKILADFKREIEIICQSRQDPPIIFP